MIYIENETTNYTDIAGLEKKIKEVINFALEKEQMEHDTEVSVMLVDNEQIKEINNETRNIDKATDVLSFPMIDYPGGKVYKEVYLGYDFSDDYFEGDNLILGDIVISLEKCEEQSKEFNHSFERECAYLIVHSVLHLLGYDHIEEDDKKKMRKREEEILEELKITRG